MRSTARISRTAVKATVMALLAVVLLGTIAGCSTSTGKIPAPAHSGTASPAPSLPQFPTVAAADLLLKAVAVKGDASYTTRPLDARAFTLQVGCVGPADSATSVHLYQGSAKAIFQVEHQPCNGSIQNIKITADTLRALRVDISGDARSQTSLLITHG